MEDTLYRLECLVDKELLDSIRDVAAANEVPFPSAISKLLQLGVTEAETLGLSPDIEVLSRFAEWTGRNRAKIAPSPMAMTALLHEMFLLWTPVCQRDFEVHLKDVEDPDEWAKKRRTLDYWIDYCNVCGISPTLLVDDGARW